MPDKIIIGRKKIPYSLAETILKHLQLDATKNLALEYLKDYDVSVEKFIEICAKSGLNYPAKN